MKGDCEGFGARALAAVLAGISLLAVPSLRAQSGTEGAATSPAGETDSAAIATLAAWADQVWLSLLDRDGAYYGRLAEEGIFQRFNPRMNPEYELDIRTSLFHPGEEAQWAEVPNGFRLAAASINHPHILNLVDWRQEIHVSGPVDLMARYRRERTLTARRDYPWIGVRWRGVLGTPWSAQVGIGVHFFKPSADVEVALARSWRDGADRSWALEVRLAALDTFNEVIFQGLGVRADEVDAHYDYAGVPLAARTTLRAAASRWRAELHAGSSRRSEVQVTFPATDLAPFTQSEQVRFLGTLLQVTPLDRVTLALHGTWARADTERWAPASGLGFALREQTVTLGARARTRLNPAWAVETELVRVRRPEWRTPDGGAPREHRDREVFARAALVRYPEAGWTARLAYTLLDRDSGFLAPWLTAQSHRLITEAGHRFRSGFEVTAGAGWDLDNFGRAPFDGGLLRLSAGW
ncbi:MAG: hypothetical protein F4139_01885 [Gemmatimonadetes bacterium]|nr:hypothetical protein [Gemmatimonadota bacterium]MYH51680.1 hypothetical protein [Gemmatimonadota bacterium]MYK67940.1 hypothetical protein [Gemmatimonadota bacterium]